MEYRIFSSDFAHDVHTLRMLMCVQMTAFRAVSHDDQIQLLKGGSIELLILRSVLTFDKDKQQFLDPLDPEETAAVKVTITPTNM